MGSLLYILELFEFLTIVHAKGRFRDNWGYTTKAPNSIKTLMKKLLFIAIILISISSLYGFEIPGKIQFKDSTWEKVMFIMPYKNGGPSYLKIQGSIRYYRSSDEKRKKKRLYPDDAIEFQFRSGREKVRMLAIKSKFMKLVIDGPCKLFESYSNEVTVYGLSSFNSSVGITHFIQLRGESPFEILKYQEASEALKTKFKDCPQVVEKIPINAYQDMPAIVNQYNLECGKVDGLILQKN